jgi:hypothetical protein
VFGHGHAARADVSAYIDPALGHRVGHTVGRVAVDHDVRPGVKPAHIVGTRPEDFDQTIRKAHRAHALPGGAGNFYMNLFLSALPEPAPDAVLAESLDLQHPAALLDCLLNLLFENARFDALAVFKPGKVNY